MTENTSRPPWRSTEVHGIHDGTVGVPWTTPQMSMRCRGTPLQIPWQILWSSTAVEFSMEALEYLAFPLNFIMEKICRFWYFVCPSVNIICRCLQLYGIPRKSNGPAMEVHGGSMALHGGGPRTSFHGWTIGVPWLPRLPWVAVGFHREPLGKLHGAPGRFWRLFP